MQTITTHLVWFRNDLRITDNPALFNACEDPNAKVIAFYAATPRQWREHSMSARQAAFIYDNLVLLQKELAELGIELVYRECQTYADSVDEAVKLCREKRADKLFYNRQYQWNERRRDERLESILDGEVNCVGFDDSLLLPPLSVLNGNSEMYKVYTPFSKACLKRLSASETPVLPKPAKRAAQINAAKIPRFDYDILPYDDFPAGEKNALKRLERFCREQVDDYAKQRDLPAQDMTSRLSAYLTCGIISVRQCFRRLQIEKPQFWENRQSGAFVWFNQLIWREFYQNLLIAYPKLSKNQPFIEWTRRIKWNTNEDDFHRWQQGQTGYPIVDAAMRQLNQTGWMHNRLRLIVASFLVKDLLIDWRRGEEYFMSKLIDGDLANNNGGWQWAASTGTDAAPYFRIFNPTTQGKRFDPKGRFIRRWLPELAGVPDKMIHAPHSWVEKQGTILDYPFPIVTHDEARKATLSAFAEAKAAKQ